MTTLATRPPARQHGLVSSPAANGRYLIRNRRTGESFQLGEEEHFLLERLDGRLSGAEIRRAFTNRFGEQLGEDELDEFVALAAARGLLQEGDAQPARAACDMSGAKYPELRTQDSVFSTPDAGGPTGNDASENSAVPIDTGPLTQTTGTPPGATSRPAWTARWTIRLLKTVSTTLQWLVWLPNLIGRRVQETIRRLQFVPRPDDVFIVTYPRSGTTWMQMILYQLTTDGNMDFPHIAEYCPWFENSVRSARAFETRPSPRLFKSHLRYRKIPQGAGRYIYVARNGRDVAVSCCHLYRMYNGFEGTFDEFFERFLLGKVEFGSWFKHVRGWWAHRHDPNVLFLTYEELSRDLDGTIRRIAAFIGREPSPDDYSRIVERCRFDFMKRHEERFDPAVETLWEQGVKLKSFLRNGRVGEGSVCLTAEQHAQFERQFARRLQDAGVPVT